MAAHSTITFLVKREHEGSMINHRYTPSYFLRGLVLLRPSMKQTRRLGTDDSFFIPINKWLPSQTGTLHDFLAVHSKMMQHEGDYLTMCNDRSVYGCSSYGQLTCEKQARIQSPSPRYLGSQDLLRIFNIHTHVSKTRIVLFG